MLQLLLGISSSVMGHLACVQTLPTYLHLYLPSLGMVRVNYEKEGVSNAKIIEGKCQVIINWNFQRGWRVGEVQTFSPLQKTKEQTKPLTGYGYFLEQEHIVHVLEGGLTYTSPTTSMYLSACLFPCCCCS